MEIHSHPALILNADYRPLSYHPLSVMGWQDAVRAVWCQRVMPVRYYDKEVRSATMCLPLPSIVVLHRYIGVVRHPPLTRHNVFLRDRYRCQYCRRRLPGRELTFDHVTPRRLGGRTHWGNVVACCAFCNMKKGGRTPEQAGMHPVCVAKRPSDRSLFAARWESEDATRWWGDWQDFLAPVPSHAVG